MSKDIQIVSLLLWLCTEMALLLVTFAIHISWLLVILLLVPLLRTILHNIHLLFPAFSGQIQSPVHLSSCPISGVNSVTGFISEYIYYICFRVLCLWHLIVV